jgi:hypothetical protein
VTVQTDTVLDVDAKRNIKILLTSLVPVIQAGQHHKAWILNHQVPLGLYMRMIDFSFVPVTSSQFQTFSFSNVYCREQCLLCNKPRPPYNDCRFLKWVNRQCITLANVPWGKYYQAPLEAE